MIQQPERGAEAPFAHQTPEHEPRSPSSPLSEIGRAESEQRQPVEVLGSDRSLADLLIALLTLTAVGASVVLTYHQLLLPEVFFQKYLGSNQLPKEWRTRILISMLIGAAIPPLLALVHVFRKGQTGRREANVVASLMSPLVLLWTLPSLFAFRVWYDAPVGYLVFLGATLLGAERLLRRSIAAFPSSSAELLPSERVRGAIALGTVVVAAMAYVAYTGYFSILEHRRLATAAYDLGIYDNLITNNLAGKFFRCPVLGPGLNYLSNHAEFGTILIAPLYALRPESSTLLGLQALFLGAAAIPLYLFAATQLPRLSSVIIACGYLLYAPLHGPAFYDFHWMPMSLPLWFGLFYAIITRRRWTIGILVFFLLTIREEIGVMLAVLGVFLMASGYWFRLGAVLAAVGAAAFSIIKFVLMPLAGTWWFAGMYNELIAPGEDGYGSVIRTLVVNPNYVWKTLATEQKLAYFLHLMAPLAFLPFRRPLLVFLAIPGFFFTLLTTSYEPTLSIRFQYTTHWIPWIFGASVLALKVLADVRGRVYRQAAIATLTLGILAHSTVYGAIIQRNTFIGGFHRVSFGMNDEEKARYATLQRMIGQIPRTASVAATETECPHIANRLDAYTLRIAHGDSDYLLIRRSMLGRDERRLIGQALAAHRYGLLDSGDDLYLFKKNHTANKETRSALRKLGISIPDGKTQQALQDKP